MAGGSQAVQQRPDSRDSQLGPTGHRSLRMEEEGGGVGVRGTGKEEAEAAKEHGGLRSRRRERIPSGAPGQRVCPHPDVSPEGPPGALRAPERQVVLLPAAALVAVSAWRQEARPAAPRPVAGGTWCCELLLRLGVQGEPPGAPACGPLRVPRAARPPAIGSWRQHTHRPVRAGGRLRLEASRPSGRRPEA